jgi:CO/xanthine dehydrogenase FAD-binding subunit
MLKKLTRFYYPKTIEEACRFLGTSDHKTAVIAGGTSEALRRDNSIEALVDLSGVKELNHISATAGSYRIGATTPVQDIYKSSALKGPAGDLLKTAAGKIGSTLLRNSITAGGNLAAIFPWSDLPVAYMVLDAEVVCRKGKPKRTVPIQTVIDTKAAQLLAKDEIIAEIVVPEFGKGTGTSFSKLAKTANDYSMLTLAARLTMKSGKIDQVRVAVNAITASPVRLVEVEKMLTGQKPDASLFAEAAELGAENVTIRKDFRASREYRKDVLAVLIRRGLEEAFSKASK